ncbi:MAG TPA: hypothetical protein VE174_08305 [Actinomycetota bacterium]|nr:hypothetical protein [Actinomycetota bacterium]
MQRRTSRSILLAVISLWLVGLWGMSVGASTNASVVATQSCVPGPLPPPVGCPPTSASPSGSGSPSASGSPSSSPSSSPSQSPTPRPEPEDSKSTISIKYKSKKFSGAVKSSSECQVGRNVVVKKKGKKVKTVGKTKTVAGGKWKVAYPKPRGKKYYAKVKTSNAESGGTCRGAKSKTIRAG